MRVKAIISYDGSKFYGFQKQTNKKTIQGEIENRLKTLGISSSVTPSGRTDKGVHATNQVIHFDLPSYWQDLHKLSFTLNKILFPSIFVKKIEKVSSDFHARFWAKKRAYRYILSTKKLSPFLSNYVAFYPNANFEEITKTIKFFEGKHNFRYFKKSGTPTTTTVRTIYKAKAYRYKNFIILYFEGNSFLRSQIRMMVDMLVKISSKHLLSAHLQEQLSCHKQHSTALSPPCGLYLCRVWYI